MKTSRQKFESAFCVHAYSEEEYACMWAAWCESREQALIEFANMCNKGENPNRPTEAFAYANKVVADNLAKALVPATRKVRDDRKPK